MQAGKGDFSLQKRQGAQAQHGKDYRAARLQILTAH
jgi:hypothetical protein